jgi:hypothetical protein
MELIDPHNVTEIFVDGVNEVKIVESLTRVVFFSRQNGIGIIAARLTFPVSVLPDVIQVLVVALAEAARPITGPTT